MIRPKLSRNTRRINSYHCSRCRRAIRPLEWHLLVEGELYVCFACANSDEELAVAPDIGGTSE